MASLPHTFVIGEAHSPRTAAFLNHASELGLKVEISAAVILAGECPWSVHYDHPQRLATMGYGLSRGEVGCFLAHRKVWQKIVDGTQRVCLVLEDDARWIVLPDHTLAEASQAIEGRSMIVRLVSQPQRGVRIWRTLSGGCHLGLPVRPGNLSVAYLITQEAAGALLNASENFIWPVDNFFNFSYLHGVDALHLVPELVKHQDSASLIGVRTKPSLSWHLRLKREGLRLMRTFCVEWAYQRTVSRLGLRFARVYQSDVPAAHVRK